MTYNEWRDELRNNLLGVSEGERKRVLEYYAEAYADRREAGYSEGEIVAQFGAPYDAARRILNEEDSAFEEPRRKTEPRREVPNKASYAPAGAAAGPTTSAPPPSGGGKKKKPVWLFVLLGIVGVIGIGLIFFLALVGLNGWRFTSDFEMAQFVAEEEIKELKIDNAVGSIKTEFYDGDTVVVDHPVSESFTMTVEERDGVLTVSGLHRRHWYNFNFLSVKFPATTVKIPQSAVLKLSVAVNAGAVTLAAGEYTQVDVTVNAGSVSAPDITCTQFACEVNAGAASVDSLQCTSFDCTVNAGAFNARKLDCPLVKLNVSAGSAGLKVAGRKEDYTILVDKSAGSCNVTSQVGDPAKRIEVDVSAGSVSVTFG